MTAASGATEEHPSDFSDSDEAGDDDIAALASAPAPVLAPAPAPVPAPAPPLRQTRTFPEAVLPWHASDLNPDKLTTQVPV